MGKCQNINCNEEAVLSNWYSYKICERCARCCSYAPEKVDLTSGGQQMGVIILPPRKGKDDYSDITETE